MIGYCHWDMCPLPPIRGCVFVVVLSLGVSGRLLGWFVALIEPTVVRVFLEGL